MVDKKTSRLLLKYLNANQSQKEVTHNEALNILDALVHLSVLDKDLSTPPVSPTEGDRYIVASGGTGAWDDQDGNIAEYKNAIWVFYTPVIGWLAYMQDETILYLYGSGGWSSLPSLITSLQNLTMLGINATADATNKFSINSPASLFNHNGAGHQIKANKNTAGDTVSHLFQTGFSGRAEFGLIGDDDFTLKVSPDGSSFNNALKANKTTGVVNFPQGLTLGAYTDVFDDYVKGAFTPVFEGVTVAGTGQTYSGQIGRYVRIGDVVHYWIYLVCTSFGTASGILRINGLPFTIRNNTVNRSGAKVCFKGGFTLTGAIGFASLQNNNATTITLYKMVATSGSDSGIVIGTDVAATATIYLYGTYEV